MLLPGTGNDLVFHYRTAFSVIEPDGSVTRVPTVHLTALRSGARRLVCEETLGFVAVRFRTSMLRHFGPKPLSAFLDRFADAKEQFGPEVEVLAQRVAAQPDFARRARCIFEMLLQRMPASTAEIGLAADRATSAIYYAPPELSIVHLAEQLGYSCRQLERSVSAATGISPKRFQRLTRFHHTARELLLNARTDYLDTALARGYYDQAHVIHEFRELAGITPGQLLTPASFLSHFYNPPRPR